MSGSGLSVYNAGSRLLQSTLNGSLDIPGLYSSSIEYWRSVEVATRGFSRDAVHIHAKIVSTRNREISILGMYSSIWGEFSVK